MAREINIGDKVAIFATVGKRIEDRVTLHILTANNPYSIIDPKAKPGDKLRFEGDVVFVDEELGRVTVQVLGPVAASVMSERGFVGMLKRIRTSPPMPWYNLRAMEESDMQSLYQYIRSLGKHGKPAPSRIRSDKEPTTPYVQLVPPQMPKN
jgi:hypothetical protein